jgi:hypothetical protein
MSPTFDLHEARPIRRARPICGECQPPNRHLTTQPWRCHGCGALLGIEQGGELHVKYKELQHWITGRCRHLCRRCGAMNTLHVTAQSRVACKEGQAR